MRQHGKKRLSRARVAAQGGGDQGQRTNHGGEGVGVQVQVQPVRLDEQQQQAHRIAGEDGGPGDGQPPLFDRQAVEGQPDPAPPHQPRQAARQTFRLLLLARLKLGRDGAGQGADLARDLEIATHEALDRQFVAAPPPAHAPGDFRLEVEGQLLLGPPGDQMQQDAHPPQKADRLAEAAQLARGQQALQRRLPPLAVRGQGPSDPEQGVEIAKPALAVLNVGLDAIAHGARLLQAHVALGHFGGDERARIGAGDRAAKPLEQALAQGRVPRHHPRFQQGGAHRHVVARQGQGLADGAEGRTDLHAQVPQDVMDELGHRLGARADRLARPQEQQVEVGKRRQHPAPVTADRQQGQPLVRRRMDVLGGEPPQGRQQGVGRRGVEARRLGPVGRAFGSPRGAGAVGVETFAQERGDGRTRVPRRSGVENVGRERGRSDHAGEHSTLPISRSSRRTPGSSESFTLNA
ncbi:hypothetical protein D3C80_918520 [compost metagenome]